MSNFWQMLALQARQRELCISIAILAVAALLSSVSAETLPDIEPDANGVIFVIGEEDGTRSGYQGYGWGEVDEHACVIGVDCLLNPFPSHLHTPSSNEIWATSAVERVTITFRIGESYDDIMLRLVRAGAETIAVSLDDRAEVLVTKSMMEPPTFEHSGFGAFDLNIGHLESGTHVLRLSVAEDGEGNGRFGWDAIVLWTAVQ